jgi:conjugal transfer mating pair stabilization protein TraG
MDSIIYTYGGGDMLWTLFNGIALIFKSNSPYLTSVGYLSMLVGGIWGTTAALYQANIGIFAKSWFIPSYAILSLMLVPKVTVNIVDEVDPYFKSDRVDNIPVGIAVVASTASTISRALTEEIESVFPTPDSLRYAKAGPVFGARLAAQARYVRIKDPIVRSNVKNFMRQCFFWPFVASNLKGLKHEALTTSDILSFIRSNPHPWLGVYWKSSDGSQTFMDCKVAVSQVAEVMAVEGDKGLLHLASTLFGGNPDRSEVSSKEVSSNLKHMMGDAWSSLARQTSKASASVGQQMLVNAYREAVDDTREEMGQDRLSPDLLSYSATRTLAQQSMSFLVKGTVATSFMPMVQAILFGMLLIIFVLIIPLCFVPGGLSLLALWIRLIFWVQSFPVFSAILSALTTMLHQRMNEGIFRTVGSGFSVETTTALSDAAFDAACLMSGLQLSVPFIAYAFISKSGYALTNVASMMSSGVEGIASKIGGEMADGNISFDNQSFHNQTVSGRQIAQQQLGSQFNYGSSLNDGKMTLSTSMDGLQTVSVMQSTLTSNVSSNDNLQASINDNYTKSQQLMDNATRSFMKSTSDTASQLFNFTNRLSHGVGVSDNANTTDLTDIQKRAEQTQSDLKNFAKRHGVSEQTATEMALRANAGIGINTSIFKAGIDGSAGISANAQNQKALDALNSSDLGRRVSEGIGEVIQYSKQHGSNINDQAARDSSRSLQGAYATMNQASEQFQKAYTQSENWAHAKTLSDTKGISLTTNENETYLRYVASKRFGGDIMQAAHYVESNPHNVEQSEFMESRKAAFASWVIDANHILSDGEIQNYLGSVNQMVVPDSLTSTKHHMDQANLKSEEAILKDIDLMGSEMDKSRGSNASEIKNLRFELEQQYSAKQNAHQKKDESLNITRMGKNAEGWDK